MLVTSDIELQQTLYSDTSLMKISSSLAAALDEARLRHFIVLIKSDFDVKRTEGQM
jgi:hypothetical protein